MTTRMERFAAWVAAAGLALGLAVAGWPTASAQPVGNGRTGSITVNKESPVAAATYQVTRIAGVDVTTAAGSGVAAVLQAGFRPDAARESLEAAGYPVAATPTATSPPLHSSTSAVFTGLATGLYLVEQAVVPPQTAASVPFLVTIPMASPLDATQLMYDITAYPKDDTPAISVGTGGSITQSAWSEVIVVCGCVAALAAIGLAVVSRMRQG